MNIFLICPVTRVVEEEQKKIRKYVEDLEKKGNSVHWPMRDTEQNDPTHGYEICKTNFQAIIAADEIHIWYNETSGGSKFDMGGTFMLVEILGMSKKIIIANDGELEIGAKKSFLHVFRRIMTQQDLLEE
ncbi:MAG: hypothetical protein Q8R36_01005 [bacterium]|nr:hypothetical protein [bacterium]